MIGKLFRRIRDAGKRVDSVLSVAKPAPIAEVDAALGLQNTPNTKPDLANPPLEKPISISNDKAFDSAAFFAVVRKNLFGGKVSQKQVDGCNAILAAMEGKPLSWCAYALATAYHETAYTMQPVKEYGGKAYFMRQYDKAGNRPNVAKALGNTEVGDGALYAGRGYVQLTGRRNYGFAQAKLGEPLLTNPDLAMQPEIAARILREGMMDAWFTGHGFVRHLPSEGPATKEAFGQARRIINGVDKADKIADEAIAFQAALIAGGWE